MKIYQGAPFESRVISNYKELNEEELSLKERVVLQELKEIMKEMGMERYFHLGNYAEQRICLFKENNLWEVYIGERGCAHCINIFDDIVPACIQVIMEVNDSKQEFERCLEIFKQRIKKRENI